MSGVCGAASFDGVPVTSALVEGMCAAAAHRGPDGTRLWRGDGAVLAHQALNLVPEELGRPQPVVDGGLVVVADARLDNRPALVDALARAGVAQAAKRSDAALILSAFRRWGEQCAEHLIGDYAFVVWEEGRRRLFAARDPLGMRSLAYRVEPGNRVLFATEVKQILAAHGVPARVFEPAVAADFAAHFGRSDWSFYEGIALLPPGHAMTVDRDGHRVWRFWDIDPDFVIEHADERSHAEQLHDVFCEAVAARLRTQKPAGILLSGGLDSGSAASAAGWLLERTAVPAPSLHACCWAFESLPQCDERHISRHIVQRYGLGCLEVPADEAGPLACFPEHLPDRDDPMLGAFQPLIEHSLEALRAAGVGVVLGGDRGDLVIGNTGYSYVDMARARQWETLRFELRTHRQVLGDPWARLLGRHFVGPLAIRLRRRSLREWISWSRDRMQARVGSGALSPYPKWVREDLVRRVALDDVLAAPGHVPEGLVGSRGKRYRSIFTQLHVRGIARSERLYARYGVGFADPFSDPRVAALAIAVPQQVLNRPDDFSKPLMRQAMFGVMPEAARRAATKIVPSPLYEGDMRGRAVPLVRELLTDPQVAERGWVDGTALRHHYEAAVSGQPLRAEFWWTLGVELWLRAHFT